MSDEGLHIFADEAEDLLASAEQALLRMDNLEDEVDTLECVNEIFRTFHTIKGAAGLFGFNEIVDFTHIVESVFVKIREGIITVDENMVSLFLANLDHLEYLVKIALSDEDHMSVEVKKRDDYLVGKLNAYLAPTAIGVDKGAVTEPKKEELRAETEQEGASKILARLDDRLDESDGVVSGNWHISLRFGPAALRNGMDPASFIKYLANIGELKSVNLIDDSIPGWAEFDPESCYLGFEIVLVSSNTNKEEIEEVFEFVLDDCHISILPPHSHINSYIQLIEDLPEDELRIGDILVACGALTEREKDHILNIQDDFNDGITAGGREWDAPLLGKIAVGENVVEQEVVDAAIKKQKDVQQQNTSSQQTIRVNALKLEDLVNLVGELVIGSANADLNARQLSDANLNEAMENLLRLVEEVRDTALGLRMVQIGETFNRFKRVVREVSRDTGKDIELRISGAETELDKTLIEKIGDPIMHLVRNAIDHGIESPAIRKETGKAAKGVVSLSAFHESGSVVIRITDDGGGLSKEKILNKAIEKGLVNENQQLSDQEIFQLIFEAGFSTAESVSNISGRGVGMDVVRRNIESLRGQVEIESEEGKGSTIAIRLPLTLAIIDGFQVRVGDAQYIVPLDMVDECIELNESLREKDGNANYLNLRGEILPFVHLKDMFRVKGYEGSERNAEMKDIEGRHRDNIVVVQFGGKKAGFVVDELLGEHQTVIKPLGKVFRNLKGISGTTILGSGEVAMIIDIPEMVSRVVNSEQKTFMSSKTI